MSPVSGKLGLVPVSYTLNNSCDLVLTNHIDISCNTVSRGWGFLDAIIMLWTLCLKCHRHVKIVDMHDERNAHNIVFADSCEV